jgi:hypothetical protein
MRERIEMAGKKGMHKSSYLREEAVERIRSRILNSQIADRIVKHALGQIEMTQSQVRAAEVCLRKVMPDLASQEIDDKRGNWAELIQKLANQHVSTKPAEQTQPEPSPESESESHQPPVTH